jgi:hypothetical protein
METTDLTILQELSTVPWKILRSVYGNAHPTIIGLLIRWWVELAPKDNWVLDGAPDYKTGHAGRADAILGKGTGPVGVIEVEGGKYKEKADTIGYYFDALRKELYGIKFGVLVLYGYLPKGKDSNKRFPPVDTSSVLPAVAEITTKHPGKGIVVVTVDKTLETRLTDIRATRDYYSGVVSRCEGNLIASGEVAGRQIYYSDGL